MDGDMEVREGGILYWTNDVSLRLITGGTKWRLKGR